MTEDMSLIDAARVPLSRPRLVFAAPLLLAVVALAATYLMQPRYTASVAFVPERLATSGVPASLAGLAGAFGINVITDIGRPPAFYVGVLDSRQLKVGVLSSTFADPRRGAGAQDSLPLLALIDGQRRTHAESVAAGVRLLTQAVTTVIDSRTGIIYLSVETPYPELSAAIAMRFVERLNDFNTTQRQSQARERRSFIEGRIAVAERALRSPPSAVAGDGAREAYLTLQREYELARIEEVNNTPVLTIVDPAVPPVSRSWPQRKRIFAGVLIVGVLLGTLAAFVMDYLGRARASS
jgi:uncharacterized protein involved in exopolysaccharide biosynthesis